MQRLLLTCLTFFCLNVSAQDKVFTQTLGWRGNAIELHTITDKAKRQVCTVAMSNDSLKVFVLNAAMQPRGVINLSRRRNENLLGGFFRNKKLYLFLDNGAEPGMHNWVIDLASSEITEHVVDFDVKREKIIDRISCGDHFLYFTIDKKTSEFIIHDFTSEENVTTTRHTFDGNVWKELTAPKGFSRAVNVEKVDVEGDCSVDVAVTPNKIYLQGDMLHLIMNKVKGTTRVYSFNLADQKVSIKNIDHGVRVIDEFGQNVFVDNSFLLKDKLYYMYATADSLRINILDFATGNVINTFFAERNDEITFKNTLILQEGGAYGKNTERVLRKTVQLLRKMANSKAVIAAVENQQGEVELTVGSYEKVSNGGGSVGMWTPMGGGAAPTMVYMSLGGFYRNSWTKSARFKMLIDPITNQHIEGADVRRSINERIEAYTEDIKIPAEAENLFVCNSKYYYAFYDKSERKLSILEF